MQSGDILRVNAFAALERGVKRWCPSEHDGKLKPVVCLTYLLVVDNHPTAQDGKGVRVELNATSVQWMI